MYVPSPSSTQPRPSRSSSGSLPTRYQLYSRARDAGTACERSLYEGRTTATRYVSGAWSDVSTSSSHSRSAIDMLWQMLGYPQSNYLVDVHARSTPIHYASVTCGSSASRALTSNVVGLAHSTRKATRLLCTMSSTAWMCMPSGQAVV